MALPKIRYNQENFIIFKYQIAVKGVMNVGAKNDFFLFI